MMHRTLTRRFSGLGLAIGFLVISFGAHAAPVYLECQTADDKGKKVKVMAFTLDESAQTVSGALGVMDGAPAGLSPESERNLSAVGGALGGEKPRSSGSNLRAWQTRKAIFSADHVEFTLLQPAGGEGTAVSFSISRTDLSITEKYPLMKSRTGSCKVLEPPKRAF